MVTSCEALSTRCPWSNHRSSACLQVGVAPLVRRAQHAVPHPQATQAALLAPVALRQRRGRRRGVPRGEEGQDQGWDCSPASGDRSERSPARGAGAAGEDQGECWARLWAARRRRVRERPGRRHGEGGDGGGRSRRPLLCRLRQLQRAQVDRRTATHGPHGLQPPPLEVPGPAGRHAERGGPVHGEDRVHVSDRRLYIQPLWAPLRLLSADRIHPPRYASATRHAHQIEEAPRRLGQLTHHRIGFGAAAERQVRFQTVRQMIIGWFGLRGTWRHG